ncbi:hypothetical protein AX15_003995 [Amanita polypyramis BW_CC]|nr:hypothetical protein AX15_003995 [Amanita polypyramis BW_CC]
MTDNNQIPAGVDNRDPLTSLMILHGIDNGDDGTDVSELLSKLEDADGMAIDVEGKLDDILKNLDKLLQSIEEQPEGLAKT